MFKCFFEKCECKGNGVYNGQIFAKICPKCKLKKSFVVLPDYFNSLTVEEPNCFKENGIKYLTTSGKGIITNNRQKIKGVYTLVLADTNSLRDAFALSFFSIDSAGRSVIFYLFSYGEQVNITVDKCSGFWDSKKSNEIFAESQLSTLKDSLESSTKNVYAKKVTFYTDGKIEEEDLSTLFISK